MAAAASIDVAFRLPSKAVQEALPCIEIRFRDVSYDVRVPKREVQTSVGNVALSLASLVTTPFHWGVRLMDKNAPARSETISVLRGVSGVIKPGTMTLLLAPPGHGKSAYLKMLAQLLPITSATTYRGDVTYSGLTAKAAAASGIHLGQLVQYVSQLDEHLPFLTVRETLQFYHSNATLDADSSSVDDIIDLLHLHACENTIVGNELLRGVSGGEKKRVTVGEGLLSSARFLALDEISTGLDSAVTYAIIKSLKDRASANGLGVVIALLQPTPEVYELFDEVILLREGSTIFHGPREQLVSYFTSIGFAPPEGTVGGPSTPTPGGANAVAAAAAAGGDVSPSDAGERAAAAAADPLATTPPAAAVQAVAAQATQTTIAAAAAAAATVATAEPTESIEIDSSPEKVVSAVSKRAASAPDIADWIDEMLTNPEAAYATGDHSHLAGTTETAEMSTASLAAAWTASDLFRTQMSAPPVTPPLRLVGEFNIAQYGHAYTHLLTYHVWLLVKRHWTIAFRNMVYIRMRLFTGETATTVFTCMRIHSFFISI